MHPCNPRWRKNMDLDTFRASLADAAPPSELAPALRALWHEAKDDWQGAHHIVQEEDDDDEEESEDEEEEEF